MRSWPGEHGRTTIEWAGVAGISARTAGDDEPIDPSQRLMLAFDDDPATSWLTGAGSAQVDATIDIRFITPVTTDSITIAQPTAEAPARRITSVELVFNWPDGGLGPAGRDVGDRRTARSSRSTNEPSPG